MHSLIITATTTRLDSVPVLLDINNLVIIFECDIEERRDIPYYLTLHYVAENSALLTDTYKIYDDVWAYLVSHVSGLTRFRVDVSVSAIYH